VIELEGDIMDRVDRDEEREDRISNEVTVDAYDAQEVATGWYYYLDDKLHLPFKARCIQERAISPLQIDEVVEAFEMAPAGDCESDMLVIVRWMDRTLGVPLTQLVRVQDDAFGYEESVEAIGDWHYWIARGYQLV
jgi:hypothetical protein